MLVLLIPKSASTVVRHRCWRILESPLIKVFFSKFEVKAWFPLSVCLCHGNYWRGGAVVVCVKYVWDRDGRFEAEVFCCSESPKFIRID